MTSTVDRTLPAPSSSILSATLRTQFGAAADDIEALQGGNVPFVATGSTMPRALVDRFETVVDVRDFGARCDAVYNGSFVASGSDDTIAIQAAHDAVAAAGGGALLIPGRSLISSQLNVNAGMVSFVGLGATYGGDTTGVTGSASGINLARAASRSALIASPSATPFKMIRFCSSQSDTTAASRLRGGGVRDILIDGQGVATRGIELTSWLGAMFVNTHVVQTTDVGWMLNTFATGDNTVNRSNGKHSLYDCSYYGTGNALVLCGANRLYNSCFCNFFGFRANAPIVLEDSDSCNFFDCDGTVTLHASGTMTYQTGAGYCARHHTFHGGEMTVTAKAATDASIYSSFGNVVFGKTMDNSSPKPTIENGAELLTVLSSMNFSSKFGSVTYGGGAALCTNGLSGSQTISNNTTTIMTWVNSATAQTDLLSALTSSSTITIPNAVRQGSFTIVVPWNASATGVRYIDLYKNGTTVVDKDCLAAASATLSTVNRIKTGQLKLTPGDTYQVRVFQTSGGNLDILTGGCTFELEYK